MKKILIVLGTRPEIIRFSPLIKEFLKHRNEVKVELLHTGQHYSYKLDKVFFEELNIVYPSLNLNVGSSNPAEQVSKLIAKSSSALITIKPDIVCVWGDTNSSLGVALAANKNNIPLAHIEAGCRSFDLRMQEEHNRRIIDHISDYLFPLSTNDLLNLTEESVWGQKFMLGDPLLDAFRENVKQVKKPGNIGQKYALVTLHRSENVSNKKTIASLLSFCKQVSDKLGVKLFFPLHPKTKKAIIENSLDSKLKEEHFVISEPVNYMQLLSLLTYCEFVMTDSGGLQKEAFFAHKPCLTLRKSSEWVDTLRLGTNFVLDPDNLAQEISLVDKKVSSARKAFANISEKPYGNGHASAKIVQKLVTLCQKN